MAAFAKTTRPTLARTLARPRLFRRLDRAGQRPVTWVWAPPGSGKTTMVASYLAARRHRVLWYQLDEGDADVATFFYYLGGAAPSRRRPLALLTTEYRAGLAVFARRFFRELYARLPASFALVFDNYQEVPLSSELHEVMREAIEEIPEGARVVFLSGAEPPPTLARALVNDKVAVLDWSELRFTPPEARALVQTRMPGRWSSATLRSLYERTDGWCAGLILLLDQPGPDGAGSPRSSSSSQEVLFDYFAGEILKRADPAVQDVLMRTAFLPRMTPAMAEALTGNANTGDMLATLHKQNYFTNKQAGTPPTYEYHPLFRDFLLARAAHTYSRQTQAQIRAAAAALLDDAGRIEAAADLLREAEDWPGLTLLIHRHAQSLVAQGRGQTLEEWLGGIPPAIFDEQPWLLFWRGLAWLAWRHTDSQRTLEQAFVAFRRSGDSIGMFLSWSGVVFALISEGNLLPMGRWIGLLDEIIRETPEFPSKGVETRVATAMLVAITWRQPRHPDANRWAERAIELGRRHPDITTRAMATVNWLQYQLMVGDLAQVAPVIDEMRAVMRDRGHSPVEIVNAGMPVVWYEAIMAVPSYRRTVAAVLEIVQSTGMFYTARHVILCGGLLGALSDGDLDTAAAWLRELEVDVHLLGPLFRCWHLHSVVWEALIRRDVTRAARYQPEMMRLAEMDGCPLDVATAHLTSAQIFHARGDGREARAALERALEIAHAIRSDYATFMARLIEADLDLAGGHEAEGLHALKTALALGREHGYVNTHVWIAGDMARLCAHALRHGIEVEYTRDLVRRRALVPDTPPVDVEAWPWPIKIFTLGRFEVQRDEAPLVFSRKVQRKPLALLKTVIAFGGRAVREDLVMDALWPEASGDAARMALASALHRLRGLLGHETAITRQEGQLSLDARLCWVDLWAVEHLLTHREGAAVRDEHVRKALALHRGAFLAGDEGELPQVASLADGLRRRLLRQITRLARQHESADPARAAELYEEALRVDPCAEDISRYLMSTYHRLGRRSAVADVYGRCRSALAARLGGTPAPDTERLFKTLRAD